MIENQCKIHENHEHEHGENCGHLKVKHGDHCDDHGAVEILKK